MDKREKRKTKSKHKKRNTNLHPKWPASHLTFQRRKKNCCIFEDKTLTHIQTHYTVTIFSNRFIVQLTHRPPRVHRLAACSIFQQCLLNLTLDLLALRASHHARYMATNVDYLFACEIYVINITSRFTFRPPCFLDLILQLHYQHAVHISPVHCTF